MSLRCIHLSDIHWRGLTRHSEYKRAFEKFFEKAKELKPNCIFIGGDIVHSKTQGISPELIDSLVWWFKGLADIAPTHIILGNHDGLILNKDRQDAITPIVNSMNNDNLFLYKKSGTYELNVKGFNLCVYSCFDEDNWPNVEPDPKGINIAAFHGGVMGSVTDIDWTIEADADLEMFDKFDFTFLGDIHKLQYLGKEKRIAYPGSSIQQNYGEDPGKGFLFWEIEDKDNYKSTFYEIPHDRPFVTIEWDGDFSETLAKADDFMKFSRVRVKTKKPISQSEIKHLHSALKEKMSASEIVFKHEYTSAEATTDLEGTTIGKNLRDIKTHQELMSKSLEGSSLEEDTKDAINHLLLKYFSQAARDDTPRNVSWSLQDLKFENTFTYGKGNKIDFTKMSGITGLFGKNRSGKSSIPGTIMFTLFNGTDRGAIKNLHVINMRKGYCLASARITANGRHYLVERQAVRKTSRAGVESATTNLNISEIDSEGNIIKDLNGEQRRDTEKVLRKIVGGPEDFLMTSLASQGDMSSFIKMKSTQRRAILAKFLDLNIFEEMYAHAKSDALELKGKLSGAPDRNWSEVIEEKKATILEETEKKDALEADLAKKRETLDEIKITLATFSEKDLVTPDEVNSFQEKLLLVEKDLEETTSLVGSCEQDILGVDKKLEVINTIKEQFPIQDITSDLKDQQLLEGQIISIEGKLDKEKTLLKRQENSIKILSEVPCGDQFPGCKFIKDSHKNKKKIEKQRESIDEIKSEMRALKSSLRSLKKRDLENKIEKYNEILLQESSLQKDVGDKKVMLSNAQNQKESLTFRLSTMNSDLENMKLRVSNTDEAIRLKKCREAIARIEAEIAQIDAERISCAEKVSRELSDIEKLKEERLKYADLIKNWRAYDFFTTAVSNRGIPMAIISDRLPIINAEIAKILQGVVGFTVELDAPEGSNAMDIYINYGDSRRIIECASGMEKLMASLAIRVALINISSLPKTNMLIIDEGFGALDDMNVEACSRLLSSLKKWFKNIMIISHVDAVKDVADNTLEISKSGKDSFVTNV